MDPVQRAWMFNSWLEDKKESFELYKNHAYLVGGFSNPQMLQNIIDEGKKEIKVNEKDFEQSLEIIKEFNKDMENKASLKKRRRHKKVGN